MPRGSKEERQVVIDEIKNLRKQNKFLEEKLRKQKKSPEKKTSDVIRDSLKKDKKKSSNTITAKEKRLTMGGGLPKLKG